MSVSIREKNVTSILPSSGSLTYELFDHDIVQPLVLVAMSATENIFFVLNF